MSLDAEAAALPAPVVPIAWALYDLAYTMFTFVVFARFFNTWLINDLHRPDIYLGITQLVTAVGVVVLTPIAGAMADHHGRRKPFLVTFTVAAALGAMAIGVVPVADGVLPALVLSGLCALATQLAFAQYDPMLADVASERDWGRVSGLAVMLGFVGIIVGLVLVGELIVADGDKQGAFIPAGIFYLAFALPCFVFVREHGHARGSVSIATSARASLRRLRQTARDIGSHRPIVRLLAARFLYTDAVGTLNIYLAVYITRVGGFSESQKNLVLALGVAAAGAGALVAGRVIATSGPRRPLLVVLPIYAGALMLTAAFGTRWSVWLLAPVVGAALGTVWTSDRVFMLRLTPPDRRGEMFGFFNLVGRAAAAIGPVLLWGGAIYLLHDRTGWLGELGASRVALGLLACSTIAGFLVLRPLSDLPRHS